MFLVLNLFCETNISIADISIADISKKKLKKPFFMVYSKVKLKDTKTDSMKENFKDLHGQAGSAWGRRGL